MANGKKYSFEQKYKYHMKRDRNCSSFGIKYGSPKQFYSMGFVDGADGRNNSSTVSHKFGNKSGFAYDAGYKRARAEISKFVKKNGAFFGF